MSHVSYEAVPADLRALLEQVYEPEGVEIWWTGAARQFDGRAAIDVWRDGRSDEVLAAAERLVTGSFS